MQLPNSLNGKGYGSYVVAVVCIRDNPNRRDTRGAFLSDADSALIFYRFDLSWD